MTETCFTKMEAGVLDLLQRNAGQIVTQTFFLEHLWGYKSGVKSRTLDVRISKLRAKLAIDPNLRIRAVVAPAIGWNAASRSNRVRRKTPPWARLCLQCQEAADRGDYRVLETEPVRLAEAA
jgi:hypothetical protein